MECKLNWRFWIKPFLIFIYVLALIIFLPLLIIRSIQFELKRKEKTAFIGGIFVMMALPISFWEIFQHMIYYSRPSLQKHIIRILWMVPIYALNAWFGLVYPEQSIYVDCIRECYEAYVIYNFMIYLLNYLNAEMDLETNLALKPQVNHIFPLCWLPDWRMGRELVHNCRHGILQYTVVRPLTTAIAFVCDLQGVYGEGEFRGGVAFPYIVAINNLSQFLAMYCLVLFYRANREELRPMKPLGKFLCIKAVVFFSFFQGVLIAILVDVGFFSFIYHTNKDDSIKAKSAQVQNFLICIEMFIAAIAHCYSFSHRPYVIRFEKRSLFDAFLAMWDVSDVHDDIKEHLGIVGNSISSLNERIRGHLSPGEQSRLLVPDIASPLPSGSGYSSVAISPTDLA